MREELDTSPDYRGVPYKEAAKNLEVQGASLNYLLLFACAADAGTGPMPATKSSIAQMRIDHYRKHYETISDDSLNHVKIINAGERLKVNNIKGFLPVRRGWRKNRRMGCAR